ncbi:hypothetical protein ACFL0C_01955 [Patescibacteria group bacterium]
MAKKNKVQIRVLKESDFPTPEEVAAARCKDSRFIASVTTVADLEDTIVGTFAPGSVITFWNEGREQLTKENAVTYLQYNEI